MTAATVAVYGAAKTYAAKPADTNETVIYAAGERGGTLVSLLLCNNDGSARTATIQWSDGATDWEMYTALSVAANTSVEKEPFITIPAGGSLKVTQGTASGITYHATIVESLGVMSGRQVA